jgi:hypothetical protein
MFRWLNKQGVESSSGFALQRVERFWYEYREADHVMRVMVEPGTLDEEIDEESIARWLPPYESEQVTAQKKVHIEANISDALTFMGIKHRFV